MFISRALRTCSTRRFTHKLSTNVQSASHGKPLVDYKKNFETSLQTNELTISNTINAFESRFAIEQPKKIALWVPDNNNHKDQMLTFANISDQTSRLANVLTNKDFGLKSGQIVLAFLPSSIKERILLFLACLKTGLVFCPYDPKDGTEMGISERIRKLSVDCIITDENNVDMAHYSTSTSFRPLKKGCFINSTSSRLSSIGWDHLMKSMSNADGQYTPTIKIVPNMSAIRLLSKNGTIIEYSQKDLFQLYISAAFWLNKNGGSRLIWMQNQNEVMSLTPWLCGSSILLKEPENMQTILKTLANYPIDALCLTANNYEMLEDDQYKDEKKTTLQQLFSFQPINAKIKERWYSAINLNINDDYTNFNDKFLLEYFPNDLKQQSDSW